MRVRLEGMNTKHEAKEVAMGDEDEANYQHSTRIQIVIANSINDR